MTFGAIGGSIAGALVTSAISGGGGGGGGAQQAAAAADPFASQRPQYQQMLSDLMTGTTPFEMTPGAKFAEQQGVDTMEAQMRAHGQANSGNEKIELEKYATGYAGQQYQQQMMNLMSMAGATSGAPGTAGNILQGQNTADQTAAATFGSQIGKAVTGAVNSDGTTGNNSPTDMTGFRVTPQPSYVDTGGGGGSLGSGTYGW